MTAMIDWWFRPEPPDKSRDFGNANIWTFRPDLDTFVREVGQNTLDVRVATTVELRFRVIQLRGEELADFLDALRWESTLRPHIEAAASGPEAGTEPQRGPSPTRRDRSADACTRRGARRPRLIGEEFGSGNELRGARPQQPRLGEKVGDRRRRIRVGKAVLWRTSLLSTVLFNSDIDDEDFPEKDDRLIGRTELSWHSVGDQRPTPDRAGSDAWMRRPRSRSGETRTCRRFCLERPTTRQALRS